LTINERTIPAELLLAACQHTKQMIDTIEEQALRDPLLSVVESRASNTAEAITYSVLISITIPTQIKPGSF
jgi:hypothetical protein